MASQGPLGPSTTVDDSSIGTLVWSNPNNAQVSDGVYTTASNGSTGGTTHYLKATNFGFSVPVGATINGILVEVQKAKTAGGNNANNFVRDATVKIIKSDGSYGTENKARTGDNWLLTESYVSYGSSSDLWSESWSPADINDSDFGIGVSASLLSDTGTPVAGIDFIRITVSYTASMTEGFNIAFV